MQPPTPRNRSRLEQHYSVAKTKLDSEYSAKLAILTRQLSQELQAALKTAAKSGDMDEANRIKAILDQMDSRVTVVSATWGEGTDVMNVTETVQAALRSGESVRASNHTFGDKDPAPGRTKVLTVVYRQAGVERTIQFREESSIAIP